MSGLHFNTSDGRLFTRRLHGRERVSATNISYSDGYGQIVCICSLKFKAPISRDDLTPYARAAWLKLRFSVPWIALRTSQPISYDQEPNSFQYSYETPWTVDSLETWADETIKWRPEVRPFDRWEELFKQTYWKPADGRHAVELHIAEDPAGGWILMFSSPHWITDGRGIFPMMFAYFDCLRDAFQKGALELCSKLRWGNEVVRLPPAVVQVFDDVDDGVTPVAGPGSQTQFSRPPLIASEHEGYDTVQTTLVFSQAETNVFSTIRRKHRCSATAAMNSAMIVADIETMAHLAKEISGIELERMIKEVQEYDLFPVMVNVADTRHYILDHYQRLLSPGGMANIVNNIFPSYHDMKSIRQCIQFERKGKDLHVKKLVGNRPFWETLVPNTQAILKEGAKVNRHTFLQTQHAVESVAASISGFQASTPGVMLSSLGNFDLFPPYAQYLPARSPPQDPFTVNGFAFGIRTASTPAVVVNTWEYNGMLHVNLQGASKFHGEQEWAIFCKAAKEALDQMIAVKASL